jgi:hypothetical protein
MPTLRDKQSTLEYYGFFTAPAFDLMGELGDIVTVLYHAFKNYGVGLGSFRTEGDLNEIGAATVIVRLGPLGTFRFKFDQVHAIVVDITADQVGTFSEILQSADTELRELMGEFESDEEFSFKTHAFVYTNHSEIIGTTSTEFLRSLPARDLQVPGEDLGSGLSLNWQDPALDARVSFSVDHSLQVKDGVFINYRVIADRDQLDYVPFTVAAQQQLYAVLGSIGLEFEREAV